MVQPRARADDWTNLAKVIYIVQEDVISHPKAFFDLQNSSTFEEEQSIIPEIDQRY